MNFMRIMKNLEQTKKQLYKGYKEYEICKLLQNPNFHGVDND